MKTVLSDDAWMLSPPDNTPDAVAIPVASRDDLERVVRARVVFPRAPILALVRDPALALEAIRAGAHATAPEGSDPPQLQAACDLALAHRQGEDARVARETAARDETLRIVSHELRNPLNVIAMTVVLLEDAHATPPDKRSAHLRKLERAVARMASVLDDTSDLARISAGVLVLSASHVELRKLVTQAMEGARDAAAERGVTLLAEVPEGVIVAVDASRVARALQTAIGHVLLATPKNAGAQVILSARDAGEVVEIELAASPRITPLGRYSPLALTVAMRTIEAHGGGSWEDAELEGSGAMRVVLPKV